MKKNAIRKTITDCLPCCITGVFFVFLTFVVRTLSVKGNLLWSPSFILKAVSLSVITGIVLGIIVHYLLNIALHLTVSAKRDVTDKSGDSFNPFVFFISFILLVISYIPYFLAYFPGILAYDSYIQIGQIFTGEYNEHHPLFHTLLIRLCLFIGQKIFKSLNAGIAVLVISQIVLLSLVMSFGIRILYKRGYKILSFAVLLILMIFPFNGFMAVSITKDIPFAAFFLLTILSLGEFLSAKNKSKYLYAAMFFVSLILSSLLKNNAIYAFALTLPVYVIILIIKSIKKNKDESRKFAFVSALSLSAIIISFILLKVISASLGAVQGDRREMLSIPIQQLARTYVYHAGAGVKAEDDNTMDEESKALINEFILNGGALLYRQDISDPVKRNVNTWVVVNKTNEFAKVYLKLFARYPGDYLNAFLAENAGFIDIGDKSHAYVNDPDIVKGHGYVQTKWENSLYDKGFEDAPKLKKLRNLTDEFADTNAYLKIPVIKYIFIPGIYLWLLVCAFIGAGKRKDSSLIFVLSIVAAYYITMFLGPTVQLRYIFPVMIVTPFILLPGLNLNNSGSQNTANN